MIVIISYLWRRVNLLSSWENIRRVTPLLRERRRV